MNEASSMKFKVMVDSNNRRPSVTRLITLDRMVEWIKKQELDNYTENGLIDLASRYPTAALPTFRRNFNLMLQRVRAKRKKEQNGEAHVEEIEITSTPEVISDLQVPEVKPKPRDDGPEFRPARRPLFEETVEDEVGNNVEGLISEDWEEGEIGEIVTDGSDYPESADDSITE